MAAIISSLVLRSDCDVRVCQEQPKSHLVCKFSNGWNWCSGRTSDPRVDVYVYLSLCLNVTVTDMI